MAGQNRTLGKFDLYGIPPAPRGSGLCESAGNTRWSRGFTWSLGQSSDGPGSVHVLSACWWGNGSPRLRRVPGVRACPGTSELRYCPDTYGWLQQRIFRNGRKSDGATPRAGRSPSGCKLLSGVRNFDQPHRKHWLTPCQQPR